RLWRDCQLEPCATGRECAARTLRPLCLRHSHRTGAAGGRKQAADETGLLRAALPQVMGRAAGGGLRGCRRSGRLARAIAPLVHELIELGAILGGAQAIEEFLELALLLVELAQRLLAIFIEGDVAAAAAPAMAALPLAPFLARLATGVATIGSIPAAVATMRAKHASTPF